MYWRTQSCSGGRQAPGRAGRVRAKQQRCPHLHPQNIRAAELGAAEAEVCSPCGPRKAQGKREPSQAFTHHAPREETAVSKAGRRATTEPNPGDRWPRPGPDPRLTATRHSPGARRREKSAGPTPELHARCRQSPHDRPHTATGSGPRPRPEDFRRLSRRPRRSLSVACTSGRGCGSRQDAAAGRRAHLPGCRGWR